MPAGRQPRPAGRPARRVGALHRQLDRPDPRIRRRGPRRPRGRRGRARSLPLSARRRLGADHRTSGALPRPDRGRVLHPPSGARCARLHALAVPAAARAVAPPAGPAVEESRRRVGRESGALNRPRGGRGDRQPPCAGHGLRAARRARHGVVRRAGDRAHHAAAPPARPRRHVLAVQPDAGAVELRPVVSTKAPKGPRGETLLQR